MDETDIYEDVERRVPRQVAARADMATLLTMFEHKLRQQRFLTMSEVQVCVHPQLHCSCTACAPCMHAPLKRCRCHDGEHSCCSAQCISS